jgi:hypothetical protein
MYTDLAYDTAVYVNTSTFICTHFCNINCQWFPTEKETLHTRLKKKKRIILQTEKLDTSRFNPTNL